MGELPSEDLVELKERTSQLKDLIIKFFSNYDKEFIALCQKSDVPVFAGQTLARDFIDVATKLENYAEHGELVTSLGSGPLHLEIDTFLQFRFYKYLEEQKSLQLYPQGIDKSSDEWINFLAKKKVYNGLFCIQKILEKFNI